MLACVDFVVMGAGLPKQVPGVIDGFMQGDSVSYKIDVKGAPPGSFSVNFDPKEFFEGEILPRLTHPEFLPIVAYDSIAKNLVKKYPGKCDVFIIEGSAAAGHNAPIREKGPIDLEVMKSLGVPFILAGGYASPEKIAEAKKMGACGVQVGSILALSEESRVNADIKKSARREAFMGRLRVITSPDASPTGFAFKCADLAGTLINPAVYQQRKRICDVGLLRMPYLKADGSVGYRCPAEPEEVFVTTKGGDPEKCKGKISLCNGLLSLIDLPQVRSGGYVEPAILTLSENLDFLKHLMDDENSAYSAEDALLFLTS